jgi:hypothetical protein
MATTTTKRKASSTKKSTKTKAKKPATKSAKTSAAKPKTASKRVTVVKAVSKDETKKMKTKKVRTTFDKLNIWNWVMAVLHAAQGVAVLLLSRSDGLFPVTTSFVTQDALASTEGAPVLVQAQRSLFDVNLAYLVVAFFFLSSLAHLYIASVGRKKYEAQLEKGMNKARWFEYSLSASIMMVAIAMLTGVSDLSTLVMVFGATAVMNLLGLVMEVHNQTTTKTNWLSFNIGTLAGLGPWFVVGMYLFGINQYGEGDVPSFVYWIFVSIFLFFSSFAINMLLQYKGVRKWKEYLYGERVYMILSLVAKSALAWQIFAGTLRP